MTLRNRVFLLIICSLSGMAFTAAGQTPPSLLPLPQEVKMERGTFAVTPETRIYVAPRSDEYQRIARTLADAFQRAAGMNLTVEQRKSKGNERHPVILFQQVKGMPLEAYRLTVAPQAIKIESSFPNGAFYAVQTLMQLLPAEIYNDNATVGNNPATTGNASATAGNNPATTGNKPLSWSLPCCTISDSPRFAYRGMHLDVCLHFFGIDFIKRYLDLMAMHKLNTFHWHLTEDQGWRLAINKYPLLTEKGSVRKETVIGTLASGVYDGTPYGGYYTQDDVREIVRYAAERYITVLPEIEMPGHALAAIACYPELSCGLEEKYEVATRWGVFPQVYCPKEETFAFLEDVLTEVFDLFPSKLIHIGGDECPKSSWKRCPHCQALIKKLGLKDEFELQSYFIQRIEKFVNKHGRTIIGWDEILQGGLAPNATVMSWLGEEGGIKAARQHHNVVMCPHTAYYLDYYQADPATEPLAMGHLVTLKQMYDYNPLPDTLTAEQQQYIIGVEGCVWTEYMATPAHTEYMAYPRITAIAETGWHGTDDKDWTGFTRRLEPHFARLDARRVNYCRAFFDVQIAPGKDGPWSNVVRLSLDAPDAEIRYTLDGTDPTATSTRYRLPFVINPSQTVRAAAFRDGKQLGKVTAKGFIPRDSFPKK